MRSPLPLRTLLVGGALALYRLPFVATHRIQDDAFITWRAAVQLADTGVYGFNPGERVSASSSHAYVFVVALLRLLFGDAYIPATLALNALLTVAALFLLADRVTGDRRARDVCWALSALTPVALIVSVSGMETALLVFLFAVAVFGLGRPAWYAFGALAVLPWVRLDAVFLCVALVVGHAWRDRRVFAPATLATLGGVASVLAWNDLYFGALLNQSITAKLAGLHASHAPFDVLWRAGSAYSALMPLPTRYLAFSGPLFAALAFLGFAALIRRAGPRTMRGATLVSLAIAALGAPAIYGAVAVIYPWYFWPSVVLSSVVLLALLLEGVLSLGRRAALATGVLAVVVLAASAGEWAVAASAGVQEHDYTEQVGRFVASRARAGETLFSDMAGSVPYYAGLPTDDEAGLVSPRVTAYQATYPSSWWNRLVSDTKPTWVVLRDSITQRERDLREPRCSRSVTSSSGAFTTFRRSSSRTRSCSASRGSGRPTTSTSIDSVPTRTRARPPRR